MIVDMNTPEGRREARRLGLPAPEEDAAPAAPAIGHGVYCLALPRMTCPLNELIGNWKKAIGLKKKDKTLIAECGSWIPAATGKRRVSLVVLFAPKRRRVDKDALWKSCLDAMVSLGILVDDSPNYLDLGTVEYFRGPHDGMFILVEDVG